MERNKYSKTITQDETQPKSLYQQVVRNWFNEDLFKRR
jgi:hypothetical protein